MKVIKILIILITCIIIGMPTTKAESKKTSGIVMDLTTGRILYDNQSNKKQLIASTTKIMTAIIAIEQGDLNEKIIIGNEILKMYGTNIYIEVGEKIKLIDLLYGLLLRSGNDAAIAIATAISNTEEEFVNEMNKMAEKLGMKNTVFENPHGLDEETKNYSTAYDMAILMKYANKNKIYKKISSTTKYETKTTNKIYLWYNRNKLLTNYEYCTGGKNGYTPSAGKTLVTTAKKNEMELVAVTLNDNNIYETQKKLYEKIFNDYQNYKIIDKETFFIDKNFINIEYYLKQDFIYPLKKEEKDEIVTVVKISNKDSKKIGVIDIFLYEKKIGSIPIYRKEPEKKGENKLLKKIKSLIFR